MIIWLSRNMNTWSRIFVTCAIWAWMIGIVILLVTQYNANVARTRIMFRALQQDHHDIQALMKVNTAKFGGIVDRNSEAVQRAAETVKKVHEP